MAPSERFTESMAAVSSAYRNRGENLAASEDADAEAVAEADGLEHDTHDLTDEQKFVGGVETTKDAESEEDFLPTPSADETVDDSKDEKPAAKKTASKK